MMQRLGIVCGLLWLSLAAMPSRLMAQPELVASTPHRSPEEERQRFHLPPGFEIELVAAEPMIHKPMNLNFDDRGRLWVTSTLEYPFPVKEGQKGRDAVIVLDDFGPDGRARKATTFADGLNIPIGVLPYGDGSEALVHSIPYVHHMIDTDGDGVADKREVFYGTYGFRDTHGLTSAFTWGFDGWIYACHGFSNESMVKGKDKESITMQSGNVYRMRPDGSHLEYYTHGQVNPFGLSFDPLGYLYSADCHSRPVYQLIREAFYPSFGKPHDGLGFGPEMVSHDHGSTAISGVVYYAAEQFPEPWRGTVFIGNVVTNRINHDKVEWHGSSPKGVLHPDFLVSDDPWFRPVDLKLGPDGALYIADFYNRIIGHYEVPLTHPGRDRESGRIWRVVYRGNESHRDAAAPRADWSKASTDELIADLADPNLIVRRKATNQLAGRPGDEVTRALREAAEHGASPHQRAHALWVLLRRGTLGFGTIQACAQDAAPEVRVHTMRVLGERPGMTGRDRVLALAGLKDSSPHVQRASAEALGRHPSGEDLKPLLAVRRAVSSDDPQLLHTVRIALRDHLKSPEAYDRLPAGRTEEEDRFLADVSPGVPSAAAARFLVRHIESFPESQPMTVAFVHHIARYGEPRTLDRLLGWARADHPDDLDQQAKRVKAIAQAFQERGQKPEGDLRDWAAELTGKLLNSKLSPEVGAGIELAGLLRLNDSIGRLRELAVSRTLPVAQRTAAWNALIALDASATVPLLGQILANPAEAANVRDQAAQALGRIRNAAARAELLKSLTSTPAAVQRGIALAMAGGGREAAEALFDAVAAGKASARLLQERGIETRLNGSGAPNWAERLKTLTAGLPPADQATERLLAQRRQQLARTKGDATRGSQVFAKFCAACHQFGGQGAKVGPQLDGVGLRGSDRLIEDILDPSRNVDLAFRTTTLALSDGQIKNGLLLREEGEVYVLANSEGKEERIPRNSVEERKVTPLSPMPGNFADQIGGAEFADLLSYLMAPGAGAKP